MTLLQTELSLFVLFCFVLLQVRDTTVGSVMKVDYWERGKDLIDICT